MAQTMFTLWFVLVLAGVSIRLNSAARLEIEPSHFDPLTASTVKISCVPNDADMDATKVSLIEIFRGQNKLIASVNLKTTATTPDTARKYQVDGQIDEDGGGSFLRVTLLNPIVEDSGVYTCVIYSGELLHRQEANTSLTVYTLSKEITDLRDRVNALEKLLDDADKDDLAVNKRVAFMEKKMAEHRVTIDNYRGKVQFESAFSATLNKPAPFKASQPLVFDKVITQIGNDYDPKTGVYTAPRDGLYFFYTTIGTTMKGIGNYAHMLVNNKKSIAYIGTGSASFLDENSVSTSVELKAKDKVSIVMGNGNGPFREGITNFGGYCVTVY